MLSTVASKPKMKDVDSVLWRVWSSDVVVRRGLATVTADECSFAVENAAVKYFAPFEVPYNMYNITACFSFCCCFLDLSCVLYADAAVVSDSFFRDACCARALRVCFVVSSCIHSLCVSCCNGCTGYNSPSLFFSLAASKDRVLLASPFFTLRVLFCFLCAPLQVRFEFDLDCLSQGHNGIGGYRP